MGAAETFAELRGVSRRYLNGTVALREIDLTISAGESVAIVGRSGSGKSTLLNILGMLDVPSEGELIIGGRRVEGGSDRVRSAHRASELGFVFQRSHLIGSLSVRENVLLGLRYADVPDDRAGRAADEALEQVGLESRKDVPARTLSGGEMQRVAIARTLARPARLWLADEPTGNLDSAQSVEIIELLKARAAERGAALVVVTHEPDIAARMGRIVTLADGRIITDTTSGAAGVPPPLRSNVSPRSAHGPLRRWTRSARFVVQGVSAHPGRARSGIVATALAVGLAVAALGLAQSATAQVTGLFDAQRATQVTASLTRDAATEPRWPIRVRAVEDFPGVSGVEYWRLRTGVPMSNGDLAAQDVDLIEVDAAPGATTDSEITWAAGHEPHLGDAEVLLGRALAERLGVAQIDVGPDIEIGGRARRVVGILESSRSGTATGAAFVTTGGAVGLEPSLSGQLFIETVPGGARNVADRLQDLADPYETTRMDIDPVLEAASYQGELQDSVAASLQVLAVVASLAGLAGVVLVNILGVSTRTAEFGVRRAFGARRAEIVALVVGECTALGALGAAIGLVLGFVAVMAVTVVARWQPVFDLGLLWVPVGGALLFGFLGGLPPAIAAGRIEPADAVRS